MRTEDETLRTDFERDGWVIAPNVFSIDEVARLRVSVEQALRSTSDHGQIATEDGPEGAIHVGVPDLLASAELCWVPLDQRLVNLARALLGDRPVYFGDSSFRVGGNGCRTWHRDNVDRDRGGPDWAGAYPVVRFGIYLQDHSAHSGGLSLGTRSHAGPSSRGRGTLVSSKPGDVVAWSLRTRHSGEAVRLRGVGTVALNPRVQSHIPRWARRPESALRMALFVTYGIRHPLLERYLDYLSGRQYMRSTWEASRYDDSMYCRIEAAGLELVGPPAQRPGTGRATSV